MKIKYLLLLCSLCLSFLSYGQTPGLVSGNIDIPSFPTNLGGGRFLVSGTFSDPTGLYFPTDIDTAMYFWKDNDFYLIDSIIDNSANPVSFTVLDVNSTGFIPTGNGQIVEATVRLELPGVATTGDSNPSLATPPDHASLLNYIIWKIDRFADQVWPIPTVGDTTTINNPINGDIAINSSQDTVLFFDGDQWLSFVGGPGGSTTIINNVQSDTITQTGHPFSFVGTMVGQEAGNGDYFVANSSGPDSFPVAFISEILDANTFVIREEGWMDWTHGLPPGRDYYLQDAGTTDTIPDSTYQIFAYRTFGADRAYFDVPELIVSSGSGEGGDADADWYAATTTTPPNDIADDIFTNGNVGINTNNPTSPLHIEDDAGIALAWRRSDGTRAITFNDGGIAGLPPRLWIYTPDEYLSIQLHPTATTYFDSVQIFRIGTALGAHTGINEPLLRVNGPIWFTGDLVDSDGNSGEAGQILVSDGAGANTWEHPSTNFTPSTISVDSAYVAGHDVIEFDATSNTIDYDLPASPPDGLMLMLKAVDVSNTVTINGNGNNIDGSGTYVYTNQYESITIIYNLTDDRWSIYAQVNAP